MLLLLPKGVKNLAHQPFGELTPQYIVKITSSGGAVWHCVCSCGKTREVPAKQLIRGRATRCHDCARERRLACLQAINERISLEHRKENDFIRNWEWYLARLTPAQRAVYDYHIERRLRQQRPITALIKAEAVEIACQEADAPIWSERKAA